MQVRSIRTADPDCNICLKDLWNYLKNIVSRSRQHYEYGSHSDSKKQHGTQQFCSIRLKFGPFRECFVNALSLERIFCMQSLLLLQPINQVFHTYKLTIPAGSLVRYAVATTLRENLIAEMSCFHRQLGRAKHTIAECWSKTCHHPTPNVESKYWCIDSES